MSIKLIVFDLDGVLVDSKDMHYQALNEALGPDRAISYQDHLKKFDGLPTAKKLDLLGVPEVERSGILARKQEKTLEYIKTEVQPDVYLTEALLAIPVFVRAAVASNSIRDTTHALLRKIGLYWLSSLIYSNQDVKRPKPHPEIYLRAMVDAGAAPDETLIVEDSAVGIEAATRSGAHVWRVNGPKDLYGDALLRKLAEYDHSPSVSVKWKDERMNVLIPMAGEGSRFVKAGYTFPKPLIDIHGKPMIQWVVESLKLDARFIYLVRREHYDKFSLQYLLEMLTPGCEIIPIDALTEGAACTTLLAKEFINNEGPLVIANSDQFIEWNAAETMYRMTQSGVDGGILTFENTHPQWSYAKTDDDGFVTEVREKQVISNMATVGVYYYRRGCDYVRCAESMIAKNIRHNNEFYVAPVFNEMIAEGLRIRPYPVKAMWGLGTPELLEHFIRSYKCE